MNNSRDLGKNPPVATTPVNYRDANTVYRSLSAVPAPVEALRHSLHDKQFSGKLVGGQPKSQGQVAWSEAKTAKTTSSEAQPCPIPLIVANAPHTSLFVESSPVSKVVSAVHELFKQHQVDVVFDSSKFKWKCSCYEGETETRFVSRLFSVPDKVNFFVLDFQRRSGDAFHFQSIYKAINFRLLKSGFVVCNDRAETKTIEEPVFRTFQPLALPADFIVDEEVESADFDPLWRMCTSPFIDVQREGLSALATQIASNSNARKALIPLMTKLMDLVTMSRDQQIRRLAVSAVSKLSVEDAAAQILSERGGVYVLVNIFTNVTEMPETRRHAGFALRSARSWDAQSMNVIRSAPLTSDARLDQILFDLKSKILN